MSYDVYQAFTEDAAEQGVSMAIHLERILRECFKEKLEKRGVPAEA